MYDPVHKEAYKGHTITIYYDTDAESPREWCNLGTLICWHRRYTLGDDHQYNSPGDFLRDLADVSEHSDISMAQLQERAERTNVLLPVYLYDHSGLTINTTGFHCPWDSGQIGYIYVSNKKLREEFNAPRITKALRNKAKDILQSEINSYDEHLLGNVFGYTIKKNDEELDACWGFFGDYETNCLPEAKSVLDDLFLPPTQTPAAVEERV